MSQPPQQPGPYGGQQPGWGQQPGAGQQPGGYPQQGGYPQSGGFPQQGGYPQTGPQPQQQPGGYGQYGQPGQPGQYGQPGQPGQPGAYDPQGFGKKKSPLPWILAGGGVVVIAVVVVLILVLTGGSDTSSPQGTADAIAKAINDKDAAAAKKLYCDQEVANRSSELGDLNEDVPPGVTFSARAGKVTESGETATAEVILSVSGSVAGQDRSGDVPITFDLKKNGSSWCVTGSKSPISGG